jgi:predicted HicB family RNase H-like nuclease
MRKNRTITFRIAEQLKDTLKEVARSKKISVGELICSILQKYLTVKQDRF